STDTQITSVNNAPTVGFNIEKDNLTLSLSSGVKITDLNATAQYMGNDYSIDKKFVNPFMQAYFRYNQENGLTMYANYTYSTSNPSAMQLLPYERINDPLNTFVGNED